VARELEAVGVRVYTPRFDYSEEERTVTVDEKFQLTREFLRKIDASSEIYVIAGGGYTGRSVCIEIGYAAAQGKRICLSEAASEFAVQALTDEVIPAERFAEAARSDRGQVDGIR
jgi:hypothetical protein